MIRILQQDNRFTKAIFALVIGAAIVTMVITLVPGIFDNVGSSGDPNTFATVHEPGFFNKVFGDTQTVTPATAQRRDPSPISPIRHARPCGEHPRPERHRG